MFVESRVEILFYTKIVYEGGNPLDLIDKEVLNRKTTAS